MAGDSKKLQPIIIKRVKKGGHAAHGGAWKIAYADFVTAMMAFFLLMWLLGSTTEGDKKGIADYFNSPLKVALLSGGSGSGDSSHVVKGGGTDLTRSGGQVKRGDIDTTRSTINLAAMRAEQRAGETGKLEQVKAHIEKMLREAERFGNVKNQVKLDMTADGLRIQIIDEQSRPMFDSGSAVVKPYMRELLRDIGSVLAEVPNRLTLEGHTDAQPFAADRNGMGYGNWELSADRANASRRELTAGGLPLDRVLRVQGLASSVPFEKDDPLAPSNRRISIIVMNRDAEDRFFNKPPPAEEPPTTAPAVPKVAPEAGVAPSITNPNAR
ncbi:MAG: flagellar motor protein MotB [Rhizobacter sp.]|jgi:chemotaxis protein MotB|nr:flagellar motor protein MotB [Rhizobacter sp.]